MEYSEEIKQFKKNFESKYENEVSLELAKYDKERVFKLIIAIVASVLLIGIGVGIAIYSYNTAERGTAKLSSIFIFLGILAYSFIKKNFESKIKEKVMPTILECFGTFDWSLSYKGDSKVFVDVGLIPRYQHKYYDDIFFGNYKDVPIEIIESTYKIGSGKSERTVFEGVIIKLKMNKKFEGHTVVRNDSLLHRSPLKNLRHTTFEDVEFEKKYDVFTTDEIEARYILTPTFMEKIKDINVAFDSQELSCAFYGNELYLAISTSEDLFSVGSLIRPVADYKQFSTLCEQFVSILALIDHLKLDKAAVL